MTMRAPWLVLLACCDARSASVAVDGAHSACFECLEQKCPDAWALCTDDARCATAIDDLDGCFAEAGVQQSERQRCASTFSTAGGPAFGLSYCLNFSTCGVECVTWTTP